MCTPWLPPKSPLFDELSDREWEYGAMEIMESPRGVYNILPVCVKHKQSILRCLRAPIPNRQPGVHCRSRVEARTVRKTILAPPSRNHQTRQEHKKTKQKHNGRVNLIIWVTCRIPFASTSKATSIWGIPRGAGGRPSN